MRREFLRFAVWGKDRRFGLFGFWGTFKKVPRTTGAGRSESGFPKLWDLKIDSRGLSQLSQLIKNCLVVSLGHKSVADLVFGLFEIRR